MTEINGDDLEAVNWWRNQIGERLGEIYGDVVVDEVQVTLANNNGYRAGRLIFTTDDGEVTAVYDASRYGLDR